VRVVDRPDSEKEPCEIADGNGGVFVATVYRKNVGYYEIIAQRVRQSGGRWPNSIYLSPLSTELKQDLAITSNDAGGAFVTWMAENDTTSGDIRLNRIGVDGALPWPSPVVVCDESGYQLNPDIIGDGFGNAVVAWEDYRNSNDEIYAQKVDAYGTAVWATNGIQICQGCDEIRGPRLIPGVS
jgi:hypothetical protein